MNDTHWLTSPSDTATWLAATTAFTACMWIPYVLHRMLKLGLARTFGNPRPGDAEDHSPWARRARQAHLNAVENLAVFAPAALLAIALGVGRTPVAAGAAATYFVARVAHFVLYTAGVPVLRTGAFVIGFGAQAALLLALLGLGR
jgi:uncharacterized MAPEG superfamily protein